MYLRTLALGCLFDGSPTCRVHHRYSTLRSLHSSIAPMLPKDTPFPPKEFGMRNNFEPSFLRRRCVGLAGFLNTALQVPRARNTDEFQALLVPESDVLSLPSEEETEESDEEEFTPQTPLPIEEEKGAFRRLQLLETQAYCFVDDFLQAEYSGNLLGKLHAILEKSFLYRLFIVEEHAFSVVEVCSIIMNRRRVTFSMRRILPLWWLFAYLLVP